MLRISVASRIEYCKLDWSGDMLWDLGGSGSGAFNTTTTVFEPTDNTTLSCAARNIQGPVKLPYPPALTITVRAVLSVYLIILVFGGAFLNTLVIVLVAKYKQLQTYAFGIALQVIVLNLLLVCLAVVALVNVIANQWVFGEHMCALVGLLLFIFTSERALLMLIFVIDRFLSVFFPFFYPKHKVKIIASLSIASWIFAVVSNVISLPQIFDCFTFSPDIHICGVSIACNPVCSTYYRIVYSVIYTPAAIFPVILYIILYVKAKRVMKKLQGSGAHYRKEWKLTITFFLLFITVFALYIPGGVIAIFGSLYPLNERPAVLYIFSTVGGELAAAILITDPIVIMRHEEVRKIRQKIFSELKAKWSTTFSSSVPENN